MKKYLLSLLLLASLALTGCSTGNVGASGSGFWYLASNYLKPLVSTWGIMIGGNSTSTATFYVNPVKNIAGISNVSFGGSGVSVGSYIQQATNTAQIFTNLPVTNAIGIGTAVGSDFRIGNTSALYIYGESNGTNGTQNLRVGVGTTSPSALFSVGRTNNFTVSNTGAVVGLTWNGYTPQTNALTKNYLWLGNSSGIAASVASTSLPYESSATTKGWFDVGNYAGIEAATSTIYSSGNAIFVGTTTMTQLGFTDIGNFTFAGHFIGTSTAASFTKPTIATSTGIGSAKGTATITGYDTDGSFTINTGATPVANGTIITVTFGKSYVRAPYCTLTPSSIASAQATTSPIYLTTTASNFVLKASSLSKSLPATTNTLSWNYHCIQ